jgi:hypothetical protein
VGYKYNINYEVYMLFFNFCILSVVGAAFVRGINIAAHSIFDKKAH